MGKDDNKNGLLDKIIKIAILVLIIVIIAVVGFKAVEQIGPSSSKVDSASYAKDEYHLDDKYNISVNGAKEGYSNCGKYSGI